LSLQAKKFKRPESVLVVVYTRTGKVLLLKRADDPDFWQSVTAEGLRDLQLTNRYPILPRWRPRYAPEVSENTEHAFALELPAEILITVNPAEHAGHGWFTFDEAAGKVASWTNREVIVKLKPGG
jgi:dATP pyrophosphohydrolase